MLWNFTPSSFIIRATFIHSCIALYYVQTCPVPPALVGNLEMTIPEESLWGLFWRGKYVIFEVADSIFIRDWIFLCHLSLDAIFLDIERSMVCLHISTLSSIGGKCLKKKTFSLTKGDDGGGIYRHCSSFYIIINVVIVINKEDLVCQNIMFFFN